MMRIVLTALLLLLGGFVAAEEPTITGETKVKPHTLVRLKAEGVCERAGLRWRVYPPAGVDYATTPRGVLEFVAPPGVYDVELLAIGVTEGVVSISEARTRVTISGDSPTPPKPPTPPIPPVPPTPTDPLAKELAALYAADTSATKIPDRLLLVELYRQASELARSTEVTTTGGLAQRVSVAGAALLPRGRLDGLRRKIAAYLSLELGDEDVPLTDALRIKAGDTYGRISDALKSIGGGE